MHFIILGRVGKGHQVEAQLTNNCEVGPLNYTMQLCETQMGSQVLKKN